MSKLKRVELMDDSTPRYYIFGEPAPEGDGYWTVLFYYICAYFGMGLPFFGLALLIAAAVIQGVKRCLS